MSVDPFLYALTDEDEEPALIGLAAVPTPTASRSSYVRVDRSTIKTGGIVPTVLQRVDGSSLLYPGVVNVIHGPPDSGKSFFAQLACSQEMAAGHNVLYLDYEATAVDVDDRMILLGVVSSALDERFVYIRPTEQMGMQGRRDLREALELYRPTLVVIDGITEALAYEGLSSGTDTDIAKLRQCLSLPCAATGAAVLEVDHPKLRIKRGETGARGSGEKLAGVQGVQYQIKVGRPFARGIPGSSAVTVDKDRHGQFRALTGGSIHVADLLVDARPDGSLSLTLSVPRPGRAEAKPKLRRGSHTTALLRVIAAKPDINLNDLYSRVPGNATAKGQELALLAAEGRIVVELVGRERHHRISTTTTAAPTDRGDAA